MLKVSSNQIHRSGKKVIKRTAVATLITVLLSACSDNDKKSTPTSPPSDSDIFLYSDNFTTKVGEEHIFDLKEVVKVHGDGLWKLSSVIDNNDLGNILINGKDSFTFSASRTGITPLTYVVENEAGTKFESQIIALVKPDSSDDILEGNTAPFVNSTIIEVNGDSPIVFDLLSYVVDPDGDELRVVETATTTDRAQVEGSRVTYTPTRESGVDTINFGVEDAKGSQAVGAVTVKVNGIDEESDNTAPIALNHKVTVDASESDHFEFNLVELGIISDKENHKLQIERIIGSNGRATIIGDHSIKYTPSDFTGVDQFSYIVSDEHGLESGGYFSIVVKNQLNGISPPNVEPIFVSTHHSEQVVVDLSSYILDADTPLDKITIGGLTHAKPPATVDLNGKVVTYNPNGGVGMDKLSFVVSDGVFLKEGVINITVEPDADHDIELQPLSVETAFQTEVSIPVPMPVSQAGEVYRLSSVSGSVLGTTSISGNSVVYTPNKGASGVDTFTYTVADNHIPSHQQTAKLTVKVISDVPQINDVISLKTHYSKSVSVDLSSYITDRDTPIADIVVSDLSSATAPSSSSLNGKVVTYVPNRRVGTDTLTFKVSDGETTTTGSLNVVVTPDAPHDIELLDLSKETEFQTPLSISIPLPSGNGETYQLTGVSDATLGVASIVGNTIHYTPNNGVSGVEALTYTVSDDHIPVHSKTAKVNIKINGVAPTIEPIQVTTNNLTPISIDLARYIVDADTPLSSITVSDLSEAKAPSTATLNGKVLTYTPNLRIGHDQLSFSVFDGEFTSVGSVDVNVESPPIPPFNIVGIEAGPNKSLSFAWDGETDDITFEVCEKTISGTCNPLGSVYEKLELTIPVDNLIESSKMTYFVRATRGGLEKNSQELTPESEVINSLVAYIKASNTELNDQFGSSISLSDDGLTLAVSALFEDSSSTGVNGNQGDNNLSASGAVYVYKNVNGNWSQTAYIKASNTDDRDYFGDVISLSGDGGTLAVSATFEDSDSTGVNGVQNNDSASESGAVYIFKQVGNTWSQTAYIKASNTDTSDYFGDAISLSTDGETLVVASPHEKSSATGINGNQGNNDVTYAGAVYVFRQVGGAWSQTAYIKASNTGRGDFFGYSVSLSGDGRTLAVGAKGEDSDSTGVNGDQGDGKFTDSGAVYVFNQVNNTWAQVAYIKAPDAGFEHEFGLSVSLSDDGSALAVGAEFGTVYLFKQERGSWSAVTSFKPSENGRLDTVGHGVVLSGDGNTLAIPASRDSSDSIGVNGSLGGGKIAKSGAVYLFKQVNGTWIQTDYIKATNAGDGDLFGQNISLSFDGAVLAVGAHKEDSSATGVGGDQNNDNLGYAGAAYIF